MPIQGLEDFFTTVALSPDLAGVTMHLGGEQLSLADTPPRIVITPPGEGEERYEKPYWSAASLANPPRPWFRVAPVKAHLWGAPEDPNVSALGYAATEDLLGRYVSSLEQQKWLGYWYDKPRGGWKRQGSDRGTELLKLGRAYVLIVDVWIPVLTTPSAEAKIRSMPIEQLIVKIGL